MKPRCLRSFSEQFECPRSNMFIENKYWRIYKSIISRAESRCLTEYAEQHHIVPKSLGGTNIAENLVKLTAREHYVAHLCLVKFTTGQDRQKMLNAVRLMSSSTNRYHHNQRLYEHLKCEWAANLRGRSFSEKTREKMRLAKVGKLHSAEHNERIRQKMLGKQNSLGYRHSVETKEKIAYASQHRSTETRQKLRDAALRQWSGTLSINIDHQGAA